MNPNNGTERTKSESAITKQILGLLMVALLAGGTFVAGAKVANSQILSGQEASLLSWLFGRSEAPVDEADLGEFWRVWRLMDEKFANASSSDLVTTDERIQGAIQGMVSAFGDPYTVYLPPTESEIFNDDISGNFSGVGMEIGIRNKLLTIISPLPGTPAEEAGLLTGDVIVQIDEQTTENMSVEEAVRRIRGERGTEVVLSIFREGETEFLEITVTRDTINIPTVSTEQIDNTFVIKLYSFNAIAEDRVDEALREFSNSGAENLILDLRGNPGGYLQGAVEIAGNFLPAGKVVVREQLATGEEKIFRSRGQSDREYTPENFVVLVNQGSASASEILAGALKDHNAATVVGENTFGKGSVQELVPLTNGSSLKVTVARWLTPNGTTISEEGLSPDIQIELTVEDRENDRDPQQDAAVRFLNGETISSSERALFLPTGS